MPDTLFFHGLESGPHGSKYHALADALGGIEAPDFRGMGLDARLQLAERVTRGRTGLVLVGSSFGGLVTTILAHRYPERVAGMVLCAPALHRDEAVEVIRVPLNTLVVHGSDDDVVPVEASENFCAVHGTELIRTEDGHRLHDSMAEIVGAVLHAVKHA